MCAIRRKLCILNQCVVQGFLRYRTRPNDHSGEGTECSHPSSRSKGSLAEVFLRHTMQLPNRSEYRRSCSHFSFGMSLFDYLSLVHRLTLALVAMIGLLTEQPTPSNTSSALPITDLPLTSPNPRGKYSTTISLTCHYSFFQLSLLLLEGSI